MHLLLKILSGMANSVDPDQTAPAGAVRSGSATVCICHFVRYFGVQDFRIFTVLAFAHTFCAVRKIIRYVNCQECIDKVQKSLIFTEKTSR